MTQWPILGRDELLDRAVLKLRGGQSLVVRGEAGIGKTGLARATAERLRRDGVTVGWAAATCATRSVPFGALASYLAGHLGDLSEDPGTGMLRLFLRASEGLNAYGIFMVDDAHLLDDGSAALVHQLAVGGRLPMVLTVRSGEPVSDAVERLGRDGYADVIDLVPLDLDAVRAVLEGALDGPVELLTAERLRRWSGGNPLLLRELVLAGCESGRLGPVAGTWRWAGEPSTASGVRDLVRDRFLGVDEADLAVLRLTALAEPVEANVVAGIAGVARVDGLCRRGLLTEDRRSDRGLLGLPHPLHSEVLRADLSAVATRELRRRLAAALAQAGSDDPASRLRLVTLQLDVGETVTDEELLAAAGSAAALLDARLAERLARAVRHESPEKALALAAALMGQARREEAEVILAACAASACAPPHLVAVTLLRARNLIMGLPRQDEALSVVDDAIGLVGPLPPLVVGRAMTLAYLGRHAEATAAFAQAQEYGATPAELPALASAAGCVALVALGRFAEALKLNRQAAAHHSDPVDRLGIRLVEACTLLYCGDFAAAEACAAEMRQWGLRAQWPGALAYGATVSGLVAAAGGRYRAAARQLRDAVDAVAEYDPFGGLCWLLMSLGMCEAAQGDHDAALRSVAASKQARRASGGGRMNLESDLLSEAFVHGCAGRLVDAVRMLRDLIAHCARNSVVVVGVAAVHLYARLGHASTAARRLRQFTLPDSPVSVAHARHVRALAAASTEEMLAVSAEYEGLGMWHLAAEAAAVAAGDPAQTGTRRAARAAVARDRLLGHCDVGPLPWWPRAAAPASPLTPREREIAALAAEGLTNRAIADRLVLSVRTVENHLIRACAKIGVTSRHDLRN